MEYVKEEDLAYFMQQSKADLDIIIASMTNIFSDTDDKVQAMADQGWFKRMWKTISGGNHATKESIQQNHERLNMYVAEALGELCKRNCIDERIIVSFGKKLKNIDMRQTMLQFKLGKFVVKLNNKIERINNYHLLITEIEQGSYTSSLSSIIYILSQIDERVIRNNREMNALITSMKQHSILSAESRPITQLLQDIITVPHELLGICYMELSNIAQNSSLAVICMNVIESYSLLPEFDRKLKKKDSVIRNVIRDNQLDESIELSLEEIWNNFLDSKIESLNNTSELPDADNNQETLTVQETLEVNEEKILPNVTDNQEISINANNNENNELVKAEELFIAGKLDEAYQLIYSLAKNGNGNARASFLLGEYYKFGYGGDIVINADDGFKIQEIASANGDLLAKLNCLFINVSLDKNTIINSIKEIIEELTPIANSGDVITADELAGAYQKLGNYDKAAIIYKELAAKGYWLAKKHLVSCYYKGLGVIYDIEKAKKYTSEILNIEDPGIRYWAAILHVVSGNDAIKYYKYAAERNMVVAYLRLGWSLCKGKVDRNHSFEPLDSSDKITKNEELGKQCLQYFWQQRVANVTKHNATLAKIVDLINNYPKEKNCYKYTDTNFNTKYLYAIGTFGGEINNTSLNAQTPLFIVDTTLFGDCIDGLALTDKGIFFHCDGEPFRYYYSYTKCPSFSFSDNKICFTNGYGKVVPLMINYTRKENTYDLVNLLQDILSLTQGT